MAKPLEQKSVDQWGTQRVELGEQVSTTLAVGESYSGMTVEIPLRIHRATTPGPTVFVTGALHGDEINGTGAIRQLINDPTLELLCGSIVFVPVLNILGFDRHSRYLPDRRDLNRSFPGSASGSLASRLAASLFSEIVPRCDYGIDLHTAALRRTNYPNVRADFTDKTVLTLAKAFGAEIILDGKGPRGAFRREACRAGCPTIVMEGGEVWKVEPTIVESAVRGVKNVLRELKMLDGEQEMPEHQLLIEKTSWLRAQRGGFLEFHSNPGEVVEKGQPLATNTNLLGEENEVLLAPFNGVVVGMTTLPAVSPGEPVYHLGRLPKGVKPIDVQRHRSKEEGLEERIVENLASNVLVVDPPEQ